MPSVAKPHISLNLVVAIACVVQVMVVLDTTVVNVALPAMRHSLHLSIDAEQWVVDGYLVTLGGFLLLGSRAGDLFGRKEVLQGALVVFSVASLVGGLANGDAMLLGARLVQGLGAAALAPSSLNLITASHPDDRQRQRALTAWSIMASAGGVSGILLGGILTSELSWRWVFFVNVPIGAALFVAVSLWLLPHHGRSSGRLDLGGAMTITLATGLLAYGVSEVPQSGWGDPRVVVSLALAAASLVAFFVVETHIDNPLVPLRIFANRALRTANVMQIATGTVMTSMIFFLSQYVENVEGFSPLRSGLAMSPMISCNILSAAFCRKLVRSLGSKTVAALGASFAACGQIWMSFFTANGGYVAHVLLPSLIFGTGIGLVLMPLTLTATTDIPPSQTGIASGLINASRQLGGAVGLAVLVSVAAAVSPHIDSSTRHDIVRGYHMALFVSGCVAALAAGLALRMPTIGRRIPAPTMPALDVSPAHEV